MKRYTLKQTNHVSNWLRKLDPINKMRILHRLERIKEGNLGDHKWFGDIGELRFFFGAGYRIYYTIYQGEICLLLCAGDKSSQDKDIKKARQLLPTLGGIYENDG